MHCIANIYIWFSDMWINFISQSGDLEKQKKECWVHKKWGSLKYDTLWTLKKLELCRHKFMNFKNWSQLSLIVMAGRLTVVSFCRLANRPRLSANYCLLAFFILGMDHALQFFNCDFPITQWRFMDGNFWIWFELKLLEVTKTHVIGKTCRIKHLAKKVQFCTN